MYDVIWALFLNYLGTQDNADQYTNELDRLKSTLLRTEEEKKRLEAEVTQVRYLFLFTVYTGFAYFCGVCTRWFKYDRDWFVCKQAAVSPGHIWTTLY